jgi:hypothetical protein
MLCEFESRHPHKLRCILFLVWLESEVIEGRVNIFLLDFLV